MAILAVRFTSVTLKRPKNAIGKDLPKTVSLFAVDVREIDPPEGENVHWRLLTTHEVTDLAGALVIAGFYRRRWMIEQLFRTMKTQGFDIEALRMEHDAPRCKLATAVLIAAIAIQQIVHARDGLAGAADDAPLRPLTDAFEAADIPLIEAFSAKLEGKTQKQKNPHPKGSLAFAAWVCARLGGWNCYYGKPGPIVMLKGWNIFQAAKQGAALMAGVKDV